MANIDLLVPSLDPAPYEIESDTPASPILTVQEMNLEAAAWRLSNRNSCCCCTSSQ